MPRKGGDFEREFCRRLSAWWTGDAAADVCFWRTSQSGGRATTRSRRGQGTHTAHCGDVAALDDRSAILTRLVTWELKRGYPGVTLHTALDRSKPPAEKSYETWVRQARDAATAAKTPFWAIVHKRNGRDIIMTVPWRFAEAFDLVTDDACAVHPWVRAVFFDAGSLAVDTLSFRVQSFFDAVHPNEIRSFYRNWTAQRA